MPIDIFGTPVSVMRIGRRQAAQRGPNKANKPLMVLKRASIPSQTPYILAQQLKLAEAAIAMRGRTMEEVIANVRIRAVGATKPDSVKDAEKRAQYAAADANVARMRALVGRGYGAGLSSGAGGPPAEYL